MSSIYTKTDIDTKFTSYYTKTDADAKYQTISGAVSYTHLTLPTIYSV